MPLLLDITFLEQVVESDQIFSKAFKCKAIQDKNWAMNRFFFFYEVTEPLHCLEKQGVDITVINRLFLTI